MKGRLLFTITTTTASFSSKSSLSMNGLILHNDFNNSFLIIRTLFLDERIYELHDVFNKSAFVIWTLFLNEKIVDLHAVFRNFFINFWLWTPQIDRPTSNRYDDPRCNLWWSAWDMYRLRRIGCRFHTDIGRWRFSLTYCIIIIYTDFQSTYTWNKESQTICLSFD